MNKETPLDKLNKALEECNLRLLEYHKQKLPKEEVEVQNTYPYNYGYLYEAIKKYIEEIKHYNTKML